MQLFLYGAGITVLYIMIAVGSMLLVRKCFTIPDELFRKTLHFILLGAYIPLVFAFEAWWMAAVFALALMAILFPALIFAQRIPMFSAFMNERKKGEFKSSMALAVGMMAFSVTVCWGLFADQYLVLASIYAWGLGMVWLRLWANAMESIRSSGKWPTAKRVWKVPLPCSSAVWYRLALFCL